MAVIRWMYIVFLILFATVVNILPSLGSDTTIIDSLVIELSNTNEDTAKVFILLGLADEIRPTNINALEQYSKQALFLSEKNNYTRGLAYANFSLSRVYMDYEFDFSESLLLNSLKYAEQIKDSLLIAKVYNSLGALLNGNDDAEIALFYYKKSLDFLLRHNQDAIAAALYSNIGTIYAAMNDTTAISYFLKAAELNKQFENYLWLSINYLNTGETYLNQNNLEISFHYLQSSLMIAEEHRFERNLSAIYPVLSNYYYKIKKYEQSIYYAKQALSKSKEQLNRISELDALKMLKKNYISLDSLKKALEYAELINSVSDSIHQHGHLKKLDILEMRYKYEEEIEQQFLERELLEKEYKNQQVILTAIILFIGLILIIFILLVFILKGRIRQKTLLEEKLSQELEFKNKELTTGVIYAIQKNEILTSISEELSAIKDMTAKENISGAIDQISKKIKASVKPDTWEEFEIRFQQVHLNFYKNIIQEYPNLTPNEKRLCAFLRLNMSTKEISKITGQSVSAIEMARVRLRKKLGISNKDINLVTFLSQY